jgi:hypothetical protein
VSPANWPAPVWWFHLWDAAPLADEAFHFKRFRRETSKRTNKEQIRLTKMEH